MATKGRECDVRAGLAELAVDLRTLDPLDDDLDDLTSLADMVGDARIVALGENAHFVHEFYLARHRIVRFLVERLGFRAFCLESGLVEGFAVNDWVRGGAGDLDRLLTCGFTNQMVRARSSATSFSGCGAVGRPRIRGLALRADREVPRDRGVRP